MSAKWFDWIFNPLGTVLNKSSNDYTEEQNDRQYQLAQDQLSLQNRQFNYQQDYDNWQKGFDERNMAFQQDAYYNNYQNTVNDMSNAGLNPLMMGSSGSAGSVSASGSNVQSSASPAYNPDQLNSPDSPIGLMQGILSNITQRKNAQDFVDVQADTSAMNRKMQLVQTLLDWDTKQRELDLLADKYNIDNANTQANTDHLKYTLDFLKRHNLLSGSNSSNAIDASSALDTVTSDSVKEATKDLSDKISENSSNFIKNSQASRLGNVPVDIYQSLRKTFYSDTGGSKVAYNHYVSYCKSHNIKPVSRLKFNYSMFMPW